MTKQFKRLPGRKIDDCIGDALQDSNLRKFLFGLEERLLNFLEDSSMQRLELDPMTPKERLLAHKLAERFNFDSPSQGVGDDRHLVLSKNIRTKQYDHSNILPFTDSSLRPNIVLYDQWKTKTAYVKRHAIPQKNSMLLFACLQLCSFIRSGSFGR